MAVSLLQTKLCVPLPRAELIPRPRLMKRLDERRRLALICVPAGFGKTTLVGAWVQAISAISLAEPGGYIRSFVDEGPALHRLFVEWHRGWALLTTCSGLFFGLIREKSGSLLGCGIARGLPDAVARRRGG